MPKVKRRPYIVHIVGPAWAHGGTEQHALTLDRFMDSSRVRIDAIHVTAPEWYDDATADHARIPIVITPPEDIEQETCEADCVLHWGIESDRWLLPSTSQARIAIAHGASDWGLSMLGGSERTTDHVICVSQHVAHTYQLTVPHTVITNGIDTSRLTNSVGPEEARTTLNATHDTFVIGYLGRLAEDKRIDRIILAADTLPGDTLVLICGCGPDEARLREIANECTDTRVQFTYLETYLGNFFQVLDAFAMPSEHEGFCLAAAEAMWSGVPVIMTMTGLATTHITNGWDGLHTTGSVGHLAHQLGSLQRHPKTRDHIRVRAKENAQRNFMGLRMARQYQDLIETVVESKPDFEFSRHIPY